MKTIRRNNDMNLKRIAVNYTGVTGLSLAMIIPFMCHQLKPGINGLSILLYVLTLVMCEIGLRKKITSLTILALVQFIIIISYMILL